MKTQITKTKSSLFAAAMLALAALHPAEGAPEYTFTPIAFLGDAAPGGGTFNNDFEPSAINNRGDFAFTADLIMPGQEGVFLNQGGTLIQLARFGLSAPGGGTFASGELGNIGFNEEGDAAFGFTLEPLNYFFSSDGFGEGANGGIYRYSHTTQEITPIAFTGSPAPGGGAFAGVGFDINMNSRGTMAFIGMLGTADNPAQGIFLADKSGNLTSVVAPGTPAPNGGTWVNAYAPHLNNQDDMVFDGYSTSDTPGATSLYLRNHASGNLELVSKAGDPLPGGGVLQAAWAPRINDAGDIAFGAPLGAPVALSFYTGPLAICLRRGQDLLQIAANGDPMPGGGHISLIPAADWSWGLNNRGEVAFAATLDTSASPGTPDEGLYIYSGGALHLIARTGTIIPGVGTIFSLEMGNPILAGPPLASGIPTCGAQLNSRGQPSSAAPSPMAAWSCSSPRPSRSQ
jgi:hypothetical protein